MIYLVSGSTKSLRRFSRDDGLGFLITPQTGNSLDNIDLPWAADNGAFTGFDPAAFNRMLARIKGTPGCLFVACPDVVGNAFMTWRMFDQWVGIVHDHNLPVALVLQDGADQFPIQWKAFEAVFVGGTTKFKLGPVAAKLCAEAKRLGKWVHMGRVNSRRRLRHAKDFGCDSVDGSSAAKWGEVFIPRYVRWLKQIAEQPHLQFPHDHPR